MKIMINEILESQGKTRYWLAKETNISYANIFKLCGNKTTSAHFEVIQLICKALNCTPNDIFKLED